MNFLDFIKAKQVIEESAQILNEAFKEEDFKKASKLVKKLVSKKSGKAILDLGIFDTTIGGDTCLSNVYAVIQNKKPVQEFTINWLKSGKSMVPYSVAFFGDKTAEQFMFADTLSTVKANLVIDMMGASIAYYIPVIAEVIKSGDFSISSDEAVKLGRKVFNTKNECVSYDYYIGAQKYTIFENMDADRVNDYYHLALGHINTLTETELEDHKKEVYARKKAAWDAVGKGELDRSVANAIDREYREILTAIKGGATTIDELKCNVKKNVSVSFKEDSSIKDAQKQIEIERDKPDVAFKKMQQYVKMVIKGTQPSVILCGAPGIGKTFRVKQQLKAAGYDMNGENTIKGKCTPRQMYMTFYNNKAKGDIILIDDADGLVGPKAPEDCINILKAALDSTSDDEGRLVSYRVSGELKDDEGVPVPKSMYFNGGVIVITNYAVGQLDTALRGRSFTQSLDFTTDELLEIIKGLMPNIEKNRLSMESKTKAYNVMNKMIDEKLNFEVSIRSFVICSRIYETAENEEEEAMAESMIKEQLRNQALRQGKHF